METAIPGGMERAVPSRPGRKTRDELVQEIQEEAGDAKVKLHLPRED
jgi:hypothetical protein